jgi:hypothetical protein
METWLSDRIFARSPKPAPTGGLYPLPVCISPLGRVPIVGHVRSVRLGNRNSRSVRHTKPMDLNVASCGRERNWQAPRGLVRDDHIPAAISLRNSSQDPGPTDLDHLATRNYGNLCIALKVGVFVYEPNEDDTEDNDNTNAPRTRRRKKPVGNYSIDRILQHQH